MKILAISIGVLIVLFLVGAAYQVYIVNPRVHQELTDNPQGERAGIVMLLTLPDGKRIPVNYLREVDKVYVGADGPWWRALQSGDVSIQLEIRGEQLTGKARVILDNPVYVDDVFSRLRPTVPTWLPDWANGKLVEITLD